MAQTLSFFRDGTPDTFKEGPFVVVSYHIRVGVVQHRIEMKWGDLTSGDMNPKVPPTDSIYNFVCRRNGGIYITADCDKAKAIADELNQLVKAGKIVQHPNGYWTFASEV